VTADSCQFAMASMAISKGNHLPSGKHLLVGGFEQNPSEK